MNLKRCENGHFYDADKFASCPHCAGGADAGDNVTIGMGAVGGEMAVTMPAENIPAQQVAANSNPIQQQGGFASSPVQDIRADINKALTVGTEMFAEDDNDKTISIYSSAKGGTEPVVGWLVCIKGEYYGESFKLKTGKNFIGRGAGQDIMLAKDKSVSRDKHAIILYEPKRREFLAQAGESRELFYLNDDVVLATERMKPMDVITIGNTSLLFIPLCGEGFSWDDITNE